MKTRIWISAAGLALATSLLAQTSSQEELLDRLKAQMQSLAEAARARQAASGTVAQAGRSGSATDVNAALGEMAGYQLQVVGSPLGSLGLPLIWEAPLIPGHPYSAIARTVTMSPDGVHVDRSQSETIYRDDLGRTRREINGGRNISILDPAAGVAYNLEADRKIAMKRMLAPVTIANQSKAPNQSLLELATAEAKGRQNMTVEDLGTQVVNGVSAQGVRVTTTVPVGTFGNDRELKTVVDRWVSIDLHVLVKSVTTDSRSGAVNYDLTNLLQGPPDASLFQVPAGYTVQEGGRGARGGTMMPAPTLQPAVRK